MTSNLPKTTHRFPGRTDFLNDLDQDAAALEAFKADPQAAMTHAGLSSAEQRAVMSGDKSAMAKLAGVSEDEFPAIVMITSPFTLQTPLVFEESTRNASRWSNPFLNSFKHLPNVRDFSTT